MPSPVDICNAALSHIGDVAQVSSIAPPDGSVQAGYCAIYYPIALASILELGSFNFATKRATLASVPNPSSTWLYAYGVPSDMVDAISIIDSAALDDYSQNYAMMEGTQDWANGGPIPNSGYENPADNSYAPQPFVLEIDDNGDQIILTNEASAVLRYTSEVTDSTKFSATFVLALSYLLASLLAGPIIKGDAGTTKSAAMYKLFQTWMPQSQASDAAQRRVHLRQSVPWMARR
jgi:hypothetical protein